MLNCGCIKYTVRLDVDKHKKVPSLQKEFYWNIADNNYFLTNFLVYGRILQNN